MLFLFSYFFLLFFFCCCFVLLFFFSFKFSEPLITLVASRENLESYDHSIVLKHLKPISGFFGGSCPHSPAFPLDAMYLWTALVPSETACLESSPGRISLTVVWTSREVRPTSLERLFSFDASAAILSNMSTHIQCMMFIAFFEIPVPC